MALLMRRRCLSLVVIVFTATAKLTFAFVTWKPQSSTMGASSVLLHQAAPSSSSYYSTYRENSGEAFRRHVDRTIPNMPGANPNYRPGGKDLEMFREQNHRWVPNMPGANPQYRPGGKDLETFREQDNHRIPHMPGANPNYRSSTYGNGRDAPSWVNRNSSGNSQVVNGRPTLYNNNNNNGHNKSNNYPNQNNNADYYGVKAGSIGNNDNVYSNYSTAATVTRPNDGASASAAGVGDNNNSNNNPEEGSAVWVDRQLAAICAMGRLSMEQELYNTHRVAQQLPLDATDEEIACYLLKARLGGIVSHDRRRDITDRPKQPPFSTTVSVDPNNQQQQHYGNTKYPSYYKGSVPRSWVDGAHIYGPRQAIAAGRS